MTLPSNGLFTDSTTTNGEAKTAWDDMLAALNAMPTAVGDVTGPASSTADGIALFNGTTGKLIKNSGYTITAAGAAVIGAGDAAAQRSAIGVPLGTSGATVPLCNTANTWGGQQTPLKAALTDASTVAWDCSLAQVATLTTTAARIIGAPSNAVSGASYRLILTTGGYTPSWNSIFDFLDYGTPAGLTGTCIFDFVYDGTKFRLTGARTGGV